jgi:RNA polymerase sigma factor (sigma-70 family)
VNAEVEEEFAWLFRAEFTSVARTVFLIVHDRGRAEDIAQDAFMKALQNWRTVSGYERPGAWVRRVAIRLAVRHAKRERLRPFLERDSTGPAYEQLPDPDVARAVATLAPMQRAAVVLYYWDDRPVAEIARVLQVSESTVKQHLHRARKRLVDLLSEEVTEDVG